MSLVEQLVNIYENQETWHTKKLSPDEALAYYEVALEKDRIIPYLNSFGELTGYVESWAINYEQFGRILCRLSFNIKKEDINTGNICYIEATWIKKDERGFGRPIQQYLTKKVFEKNFNCEFFVGEAMRKQAGFVKILKRTDAIKKYLKEEISYGKG